MLLHPIYKKKTWSLFLTLSWEFVEVLNRLTQQYMEWEMILTSDELKNNIKALLIDSVWPKNVFILFNLSDNINND